ncbi:hypothetical protein Hanom_Chr12g01075981 [Helianthus anomalus]
MLVLKSYIVFISMSSKPEYKAKPGKVYLLIHILHILDPPKRTHFKCVCIYRKKNKDNTAIPIFFCSFVMLKSRSLYKP